MRLPAAFVLAVGGVTACWTSTSTSVAQPGADQPVATVAPPAPTASAGCGSGCAAEDAGLEGGSDAGEGGPGDASVGSADAGGADAGSLDAESADAAAAVDAPEE